MIRPIKYTLLNLTGSTKELDVEDDYYFDCAEVSSLSGFELLVGDYWHVILLEDFVITLSSDDCKLCLQTSSLGELELGKPFLKGYYSIYEQENTQVGFVPYTGSKKSSPELATSAPTTAFFDEPILELHYVEVPDYQAAIVMSLLIGGLGYLVYINIFKAPSL